MVPSPGEEVGVNVTALSVVEEDITGLEVDAIANAANDRL